MEREKVYTEEEAAKFLGVSTYAVRERYREGVLPALRKGKRSRLYFEADLIALRDSGKALKLRKARTGFRPELMVPAQEFREAVQELEGVRQAGKSGAGHRTPFASGFPRTRRPISASTVELKGVMFPIGLLCATSSTPILWSARRVAKWG